MSVYILSHLTKRSVYVLRLNHFSVQIEYLYTNPYTYSYLYNQSDHLGGSTLLHFVPLCHTN